MNTKQFEGHTPGPWTIDPEHSYRVRSGKMSLPICDVDYRCKEQSANAALIAAAPELLAENTTLREALRECITDIGSHTLAYDYGGGKADRRLRAINDIARAALGKDLDHRDGPIVNESINADGIRTWENDTP